MSPGGASDTKADPKRGKTDPSGTREGFPWWEMGAPLCCLGSGHAPQRRNFIPKIFGILNHTKGIHRLGGFGFPKNSSRLGIDPGIGEFWSQGLHGSSLPGKEWIEGEGEQGCWKGIPGRNFLEKLGINNGLMSNNGLISDGRKDMEQPGGKTQRQKIQLGLDGGLGKFLLSG